MDAHTHIHTYTQDNYSNPLAAHARRGLITEKIEQIVLALSIHSSIRSRNCFLRRFGDHDFMKEAAIRGYQTYILY